MAQTREEESDAPTLFYDVLQTHILSRLDGPTLAACSCASPDLYTLSTDDHLWQNVCKSTWPSVNHPVVSDAISTFPSGGRSFFYDSYPTVYHNSYSLEPESPTITELISAVDIYLGDTLVFSEVEKLHTTGDIIDMEHPFRVDIVPSQEYRYCTWTGPVEVERDSWGRQIEENLSLSWILIDPKGKRAVNVSSRKPIRMQRHWLTGEVLVKFGTILGGKEGTRQENVECAIVVTCGGKEEVRVRDVSLMMEDMEGKLVSLKRGLMILENAMEKGERRKVAAEDDRKEMYREFTRRKREWRERKIRENEGGSGFLQWFFSAN